MCLTDQFSEKCGCKLSSTHLVQVGYLDEKVALWEGAVQQGATAVVVLLKRQKWQQHELERAAIAQEAARPLTPPKATSQAARNPNGSHTAAAVQAGPSRRQSSPLGLPIAASSPVGMRFTGTINFSMTFIPYYHVC